jgi:hypothetical protein
MSSILKEHIEAGAGIVYLVSLWFVIMGNLP